MPTSRRRRARQDRLVDQRLGLTHAEHRSMNGVIPASHRGRRIALCKLAPGHGPLACTSCARDGSARPWSPRQAQVPAAAILHLLLKTFESRSCTSAATPGSKQTGLQLTADTRTHLKHHHALQRLRATDDVSGENHAPATSFLLTSRCVGSDADNRRAG